MASLFWVGGSNAYDGTTNRLATTSGGAATVAAIAAGDIVTFDANSPAAAVVTTSAAISCTTLTLNTGFTGSLTMSNGLTVSGLMTVTQGTFNGNGQTLSLGQFSSQGALTRAVDITNCTINNLAVVQPWTIVATGLTLTTTGSTINCACVSGTFTGAAFTYGTVNFTSITAFIALGTGTTFTNLSGTTAAKGGGFRFNGSSGLTVTGTLTVGGSTTQGVNRFLLFGITPGTPSVLTMTGAAVVINGDVAFEDVTISGSPSWTNTGSAFVEDCGGNSSLITTNMTTPATQTHTTSAGGNWSDVTKWTSRVPLAQDSVVVNANTTGTLTGDMPRLAGDIDFTGFAGTFTTNTSSASFGSLTLATGMTVSTISGTYTMSGRGTHTFTSAGKSFSAATTLTFGGPGGTYTLQDALTTTSVLTVNDGTFTTGSNAITCSSISAASGRTTVLNYGSSTITFTGTGSIYTDNNASTTTNGSSANLVCSGASASSRTILSRSAGGFASVTYTVANSPGALVLTTPATTSYTTLNVGSGRTLNLQSTRTFNITNFNVNGANNGSLYLPGVAANYASAPDSAALSITSDITVLCRASLDSWLTAGQQVLLGKWDNTIRRSYVLFLDAAGKLNLTISSDGTSSSNVPSTVATGFSAGTTNWILGSWRASDGRIQYFTASGAIANPVASDFTQLGADVTRNVGSINDNASVLEIGSDLAGTAALTAGTFYRAKIYNGVFSTAAFGGTVQFDADFTTKTVGANTFTESSTNAATVTINGALAQAGDGRIAIISSAGGSAAIMSSPTQTSVDYLTIQDSTVDVTPKWYAGANSVNVSGNTNWIFTAPPSSGTPNILMMGIG